MNLSHFFFQKHILVKNYELEQALEFIREQYTWENEDQETKSVKVT